MVDKTTQKDYYKGYRKPSGAFKNGKKFMLQYFKDVQAEMRHVSWPTKRQAVVYTVVVIAVSLATAVYLGLWDYVFTAIIKKII